MGNLACVVNEPNGRYHSVREEDLPQVVRTFMSEQPKEIPAGLINSALKDFEINGSTYTVKYM